MQVRKEHPQYAEKLKGLKVETSAKMTSSAAKCSFDTATRKPRCIRISSVIFGNSANLAHLDGIVRHELAHAIAGLDARHGAAWKDVCSRIGGVTSTSHSLDGLEIASPRRRVEKAESKSKPQAICESSCKVSGCGLTHGG